MGGLILTLWFISIICFLIQSESNQKHIRKRMNSVYKMLNNLKVDYEKDEINKTMRSVGLPINLYYYQIIRFSLAVFFALESMFIIIKGGETSPTKLLIVMIVYLLTTPKPNLLGRKSPFQMLLDSFLSSKRNQYNQELYMAISQLKNTFLIKKDQPPSSDMILEQVAKTTVKTRKIFNQMLRLWMVGERKMAVEYFEIEIGTKEAVNLGQVFLKLDELNPVEMTKQLEAYQEIYRMEKETKKMKLNEHKSNILFMLVVGSCLMIIVNFLAVAFFIDFVKDLNTIL